jgi:hypothetical protein
MEPETSRLPACCRRGGSSVTASVFLAIHAVFLSLRRHDRAVATLATHPTLMLPPVHDTVGAALRTLSGRGPISHIDYPGVARDCAWRSERNPEEGDCGSRGGTGESKTPTSAIPAGVWSKLRVSSGPPAGCRCRPGVRWPCVAQEAVAELRHALGWLQGPRLLVLCVCNPSRPTP